MMCTLRTKTHGDVTFSAIPGGRIYTDLGNPQHHGYLGKQICKSGYLLGYTLSLPRKAGPNDLEQAARSWWRAAKRKGVV